MVHDAGPVPEPVEPARAELMLWKFQRNMLRARPSKRGAPMGVMRVELPEARKGAIKLMLENIPLMEYVVGDDLERGAH